MSAGDPRCHRCRRDNRVSSNRGHSDAPPRKARDARRPEHGHPERGRSHGSRGDSHDDRDRSHTNGSQGERSDIAAPSAQADRDRDQSHEVGGRDRGNQSQSPADRDDKDISPILEQSRHEFEASQR